MKKMWIFLFFFSFPSLTCNAGDIDNVFRTVMKLKLCQAPQKRAMEQRAKKVVTVKDELIRRTVRAYGGDYARDGRRMFLTLNGKIYKDFHLQVVRGKYLIIRVPDDIFYLEVVNKRSPTFQ